MAAHLPSCVGRLRPKLEPLRADADADSAPEAPHHERIVAVGPRWPTPHPEAGTASPAPAR